MLKGFYGRYYFNYADSFGNLNPGGANYKTFRFLDQNGNRRYDGPLGTRRAVQLVGRHVDDRGPRHEEAVCRRVRPLVASGSSGASRRCASPTSARTPRTSSPTINVAREGQFTVPTPRHRRHSRLRQRRHRPADLHAARHPGRAAGCATSIDNVPDGSYKYDTLQFAFNKRFGSGLFIQSSFDYQWRDELRGGAQSTTSSTATLVAPSSSPLNSDPITVGYFQNVFPQVSNRQESTNWQGRAIARYVFKYDIGVATNLRVQSGYAYSRIIAATLPNAGAMRFFSENINNNRSDTVPILDLRIDKAFRVGRYRFTGMFDAFNLTNSDAVTNFNLTNGASYNQIIAALDPRTLQFGLRFDF